jgi:DNA-directed RNA polymerase subunit RPC12/RpoP
MASWVLNCTSCKAEFEHSKINQDGMEYFQLPMKPDFPSGGSELVCPECGHEATYQRTNLRYCQ